MKIRLIVESEQENPAYDHRRKPSPDNPFSLPAPVGLEIEHPDCWVHCLPEASTGIVRAEPVDDEAIAKVAEMTKRRNDILAERARRQLEEEQAKAKQAAAGTSRRSRSSS